MKEINFTAKMSKYLKLDCKRKKWQILSHKKYKSQPSPQLPYKIPVFEDYNHKKVWKKIEWLS